MFNDKTILITGGTGSWGTELTSYFLKKERVKQIRIYSRGEYQQVDMQRNFNSHPKLKFIIGDVRDRHTLEYALDKVDFVFHLAALKHVPKCEDNGWQTVSVNILGTQNVIDCGIAKRVKKIIFISTDKAVEPFNLYGITKACSEKLIVYANKYYDCPTKFICIRSGNVIGTRGSIVPLFINQIRNRNEITLTDENMTRFLLGTKDAIQLLIKATKQALGGEIFVLKMPAASNKILSKVIIRIFGNNKTTIRKIGVRPGEKMDEVLISKNEIANTRQLNDDLFVILPQLDDKGLTKKYSRFKRPDFTEFTSRTTVQLNEKQVEKLLIAEGFSNLP